MQKTFLILKHELITTLSRRSFLFFGVLLPIVAMLGLSAFNRFSTSSVQSSDGGQSNQPAASPEGFVDNSGLITALPGDIEAGMLLPYADEADARAALEAGEIGGYFLIPADYLQSGRLDVVRKEYSPFSSDPRDWVMRWALTYNLLGADLEVAQRVVNPMVLQVQDLSVDQAMEGACTRPGPNCESNPVLRMLPLFVTVLYFVILMNGAGILMRSVSSEKQNRVMEVLLVSASPQQLLVGKIVGLGLAALAAAAAWVVSGYLALGVGAAILNIPPGFSIPPSVVLWTIAFFIMGYAVYASLMAGAGALVPNLKEISAATWVVASPLFLGYFVSIMAMDVPNGPLATAISLFPLTAPIGMVMRLTSGGVPGWQLGVSAGLLALTAVLAVRIAARMFRVQDLLSGQAFTPHRFFLTLLGRG